MITESVSGELIAAFAAVAVAVIGVIGLLVQGRSHGKELKPNGGSSLRDAVDRIQSTIDNGVLPRLDGFAVVQADHANRLAVIEDRNVLVELANRVHAIENSTPKKPRKATHHERVT